VRQVGQLTRNLEVMCTASICHSPLVPQ